MHGERAPQPLEGERSREPRPTPPPFAVAHHKPTPRPPQGQLGTAALQGDPRRRLGPVYAGSTRGLPDVTTNPARTDVVPPGWSTSSTTMKSDRHSAGVTVQRM